MFALTLNDVRVRQAAIEIGRTGQIITAVAVLAKIGKEADLSKSEVEAELAFIEKTGELFSQGHGQYSLHPALAENTVPLVAAS